jgi:sRNA-binding protein
VWVWRPCGQMIVHDKVEVATVADNGRIDTSVKLDARVVDLCREAAGLMHQSLVVYCSDRLREAAQVDLRREVEARMRGWAGEAEAFAARAAVSTAPKPEAPREAVVREREAAPVLEGAAPAVEVPDEGEGPEEEEEPARPKAKGEFAGHLTPAKRAKRDAIVREMLFDDARLSEIAARLGCSESTASKVVREVKIEQGIPTSQRGVTARKGKRTTAKK